MGALDVGALEEQGCDNLGFCTPSPLPTLGQTTENRYEYDQASAKRTIRDWQTEMAIATWYQSVQAANPGTNILWHCMNTPCLAQFTADNTLEEP